MTSTNAIAAELDQVLNSLTKTAAEMQDKGTTQGKGVDDGDVAQPELGERGKEMVSDAKDQNELQHENDKGTDKSPQLSTAADGGTADEITATSAPVKDKSDDPGTGAPGMDVSKEAQDLLGELDAILGETTEKVATDLEKIAAACPEGTDFEKVAADLQKFAGANLAELGDDEMTDFVKVAVDLFPGDAEAGRVAAAQFHQGLAALAAQQSTASDQQIAKVAMDDAQAVAELLSAEGADLPPEAVLGGELPPELIAAEGDAADEEAMDEGDEVAEDEAAAEEEAAMAGGEGEEDLAGGPVMEDGEEVPVDAEQVLAAIQSAGLPAEKLAKVAAAKLNLSEEQILKVLKK